MQIYNEIIIDMNTGKTISEDSYEYDGPVMLCCGGDDEPDYTKEKEILAQQRTDLGRRKKEIGEYFDDIGGMAGEEHSRLLTQIKNEYSTTKTSRADDFLTQSYSIDKQEDIQKRLSGFEVNTEQDDIAQVNESNRLRSYANQDKTNRNAFRSTLEREGIQKRRTDLERNKAYEDQMNNIQDMLYQIETTEAGFT